VSGYDERLDFDRLKARVSVGEVLAAYGLDAGLVRRGTRLRGRCPLHGGDNPTALSVDDARGLWRCFTACGGGDVVDLVGRLERCSPQQAARHLARIAAARGLASPTPQPDAAVSPRRFAPFRRRLCLDPRVSFLQDDKRITVRTAARFEAGIAPHSAFLLGMVAVRLHDLAGAPLGYCGRRLAPADVARYGKWRFPAAFPKAEVVYNAHRALPARDRGLVVVECPWAAMRLAQAGVPGAVALLGTSLSRTAAQWLARAPVVLLLLDGDDAGRGGATRVAAALRPGTTVLVHDLTEDHEPEDLADEELAALVRAHLQRRDSCRVAPGGGQRAARVQGGKRAARPTPVRDRSTVPETGSRTPPARGSFPNFVAQNAGEPHGS